MNKLSAEILKVN
jgi:hypothetical protein